MTTWTKRTAPTTIDWVETFTIKKDTDNFYKGFSGIFNGLVPAKQSSNFYFLAKAKDGSGIFLLGKTVDNFMEAQPR